MATPPASIEAAVAAVAEQLTATFGHLALPRRHLPGSSAMRVEHIAFQVEDPVAVAAWYGKHLGFRVARLAGGEARTHFIVDGAGHVVLEIYNNKAAAQPDYRAMHPLMLHVAFAVEDVAQAHGRLLAAGASHVSGPEVSPSGDVFAMVRDPFGLPIQLVHRGQPLI